jgi:hypothetical protein
MAFWVQDKRTEASSVHVSWMLSFLVFILPDEYAGAIVIRRALFAVCHVCNHQHYLTIFSPSEMEILT